MPAKLKADWLAVEADYRGSTLTLEAIATKYGVSPSAVRKQAKQRGWLRDPAGVKAARVAAALASGGADGADEGAVEGAIQAEADRDIAFMRKGAEFFSDVLDWVRRDLPGAVLARDVKTLTETGAMAVASYRKLRGLEDKPAGKSIEDLLAEL